MKPVLVIGDTVLDRDLEGRVDRLAADAPVPVVDGVVARSRPGGAGLAACLAARDGVSVRLLTALCDDEPGRELRSLLGAAGVEVLDLGRAGTTPEKLRVRAAGQTLLRLDRSQPGPRRSVPPDTDLLRRAIAESSAIIVSDYGYGLLDEPTLTAAIRAEMERVPVLWDPHPRGPDPIPGARLVTPNRREAGLTGAGLAELVRGARELRLRWSAAAVAVTMGAQGALLVAGGDAPPLHVPAPSVTHGDPCGAGDRLAVAAGRLLAAGASVEEAIEFAVGEASAFVAGGGAAGWWTQDLHGEADNKVAVAAQQLPADGWRQALRVAEEVRSAGGRLVVTGGCFDVLHAGHIQLLDTARRLGDALLVLLNDDDGVHRLKGPGRPRNQASDRSRVLSALRSVDAVAVFDEPTPVQALRRLRPQLFVKGGDYRGRLLPEQAALSEWGGELVLVPHLAGRSTTRVLEEMNTDART